MVSSAAAQTAPAAPQAPAAPLPGGAPAPGQGLAPGAPASGGAPAPAITVTPPPAAEAAAPPPPPATFGEAVQAFADRGFEWLETAFGPLGPLYAFAALAVIVLAAALPLLLSRRKDPLERLASPVADLRAMRSGQGQPTGRALRTESGPGRLDSIAAALEPKDEKEFGAARLKLMQAGYRGRRAVRMYNLARAGGALVLLILCFLYLTLTGVPTASSKFMMICGLGIAAGYYIPTYWVARRQQERQQEITNGFPDALDLMLICVEAGQSLDQSLMRVSSEIRHAHPVLAEEFQIVSNEMRAGKDRATVLRDFAQRAGVNDVSSFVTVLVQSASFGTSVAEALRVYAAEMRDKRVMRAEEKANVLPTKLTLGTMFFTVPPLLLILIGPSLVDIVNTLSGF
ncbi:type II secretion system F family protein [Rhodovulum sp. DZ06]|uniref:type II secretion system F family protein n=1 Tax=Rhodovulum sp. DZ06 TaxID=3425126 RepID=UPI003D34DA08